MNTWRRCGECGGRNPHCWRCGGCGFVGLERDAHPLEPTYDCPVCGERFVASPERTMRCVADHHCHSAESFHDHDGRMVFIPPLDSCEMIDLSGRDE